MKTIEPGMLCLVIIDNETPGNVGRCVTAVRIIKKREFCPEVGDICWSDHSGDIWLCEGEIDCFVETTGKIVLDKFGAFGSSQLMPIPPLNETIKKEQEVFA